MEFAKIFTAVFFVFFGMLMNGVAIAFAWGWFIAPLGVIEIEYIHALGIGSLVSFMTYPVNVKTEKKETWESVMIIGLRPMIYLAMAYILKCFI